MTDQELKDLVAGLAASQKETDRLMKESIEERKKIEAELAEEHRKTDREIRRVSKQLGEPGNKFGSFTDGLAWPSLERMMYRDFGMNQVSHRHRSHRNGKTLEIDVLAYDTGALNEAYVIEVKSQLDQDGIDQILEHIALLPQFFPPARSRKIYGMIAAVDIPDNLYNKAIKEGLYIARISDGSFKLAVPRGFKPRAFGPATEQNGTANGRAKKGKRGRSKGRE
ncbi:MAG: DUF3782 domain-containing protein [Acidobacteria bacterium]|nr:DUF3782 domain-containing protein [Acidobacteriota bacterium]